MNFFRGNECMVSFFSTGTSSKILESYFFSGFFIPLGVFLVISGPLPFSGRDHVTSLMCAYQLHLKDFLKKGISPLREK